MRTGTTTGQLRDRLSAARGAHDSASRAVPVPPDTEIGRAATASPALPARPDGPFDWSELTQLAGYVDLGPVLLPARDDVTMQVEVDALGGSSDLSVHHGGWQMRLDVFAAPKSAGTWEEVAGQIVAGLRAGGAQVEVTRGGFGDRLEASLDAASGGEGAVVPVTVCGIDGPGWLLRATLQPALVSTSGDGPADGSAPAAAPLGSETGRVVEDGQTLEGAPSADEAAPAPESDGPAWHPVAEDGLPSGVLGEVLRAVVVHRSGDPLPVGSALPLSVNPELLGRDVTPGAVTAAQPSRFAHLPGLVL